MAIDWNLKERLATKDIQNPSQLQRALELEMGLCISRVALAKLINREPNALRIETAQILCSFLDEPLEAFFRVTPEPIIKHPDGVIRPYGKPDNPASLLMVDPGRFF